MTDKLEPTPADINLASWINHNPSPASIQAVAAFRRQAERAALERAATWEGIAKQLEAAVRDYFDFDEGDDGSLDEIFPTARAEYMDAINKALAAIRALAQEVK